MKITKEQEVTRLERLNRLSTSTPKVFGSKVYFFKNSLNSFAEIWKSRDLLLLLTRREIKSKYKNSYLGILWSLAKPLLQLLIYYFAIGKLLGAERSIPNFAIFVFIGIITWSFYAEIISTSTTSIIRDSGLVKKVNVTREIFPISAALSSLSNFANQAVILILGLIFFTNFQITSAILLVPLSLISLFIFANGLGLLLSALNVYFRDIEHLVEVLLVALFWISPIVYSYSLVENANLPNWAIEAYLANPATLAVLGMQNGLWIPTLSESERIGQYFPPNLELRLMILIVFGTILTFVSQRIFSKLQGNFAQEL